VHQCLTPYSDLVCALMCLLLLCCCCPSNHSKQLWPHSQAVQELDNSEWVGVAALQLPGGHHAVLKTTPAWGASMSWAQMQAEEEAACILPSIPCSVPGLAAGTDS
jgi:hypothetical protein